MQRAFSLRQVDFTLRRQFNFGERANPQFRAERFNVFNDPSFGAPDSNHAEVRAGLRPDARHLRTFEPRVRSGPRTTGTKEASGPLLRNAITLLIESITWLKEEAELKLRAG